MGAYRDCDYSRDISREKEMVMNAFCLEIGKACFSLRSKMKPSPQQAERNYGAGLKIEI